MRSFFVSILLVFLNHFSYATFAPDTLVHTPHDFVLMRDLQPDQTILSYDEQNHSLASGAIQNISSYQTMHAYKVTFDDGTYFVTTPEQRLMLASRRSSKRAKTEYGSHTWCEVKDLVPGDRLMCHDMSLRSQRTKTDNKFVTVSKIEPLDDEISLHEVAVIPHHTLLVTERGIIAHNFVVAMVPSLAASIWAGIVTAGVMGSVFELARRSFSKGGNFFAKQGSDSSDNDYDYSYASSPPPPKDPRNRDRYENMYEVFKRAPRGRKLREAVRSIHRSYKNDSKIYRAIKDIPELHIKKGDLLYLDRMHGDHIEVFDKRGKVLRTILNMDGTQNFLKIEQAGIRDIVEWIR
jgi:hypothetical protein